MTLQNLRYFVAAAQLRSFTKAADLCFVSQPAMSRAMAELEEEVGCALFHRGCRGVKMTREGIALYKEAVSMLLQADTLADRIKCDSQAEVVSVGYHVYGFLDMFRRRVNLAAEYLRHMEFKPRFIESVSDIIQKLKNGETDIALLNEVTLPALPEHEAVLLESCCLYVAVPDRNPLFNREVLNMAELSDQRFILFDEYKFSNLNAALKKACQKAGFTMQVADIVNRFPEMIYAADQKDAIGICHSAERYTHSDDVRFIPLSGMDQGFDVMAVRLLGVESKACVRTFFSVLKSNIEQET